MAADIQVRLVGVEFLRPGPPHNQLLSPLTQYLAICGDSGAGVVTVPYEHARFERRLKQLRYEAGEPEDRLEFLHEIGADIGKILGAVPGLPGALMFDRNQAATLIHLRITLSASELALLPFELAKVPVGPNASMESWLAIQTRPPVCVTRNIRSVSPEGVKWPTTPRILFVSGDPETVPYREHREALLSAVKPFRSPPPDGQDERARDDEIATAARQTFGDLLTVLVNPTLTELLIECGSVRYTHVHLLTHGDRDASNDAYGLVFRGADGTADVVSGERLASAITSVARGGVDRPTVVTMASCDSGNMGSVVVPGAGVAHALHQAGVPLVIAAQFPLSIEASVPLAATLYGGLLWGEHPLVLLQHLRAELHARYTTTWHDWASLVVYEALPLTLDDQLDALRYWQARRAMNAALERLDLALRQATDAAGHESIGTIEDAVEAAISRLPLDGHYGVECLGLRASARKREAQSAFVTGRPGAPSVLRRDPYDLLEEAVRDYEQAFRRHLVNETQSVQRIASLHWVLVQYLSLCTILGRDVIEGAWDAALLSANVYLDHASTEERAWAHGSLTELWMLRLAQPGMTAERLAEARGNAVRHASELASLYPSVDAFPITSTCRQFKRYADWWGTSRFEDALAARGVERRVPWNEPSGLLETAKQIVSQFERTRRMPDGRAAAGTATLPPSETGSVGEGRRTPVAAKRNGDGEKSGVLSVRTREPRRAGRAVARGSGPFFDVEMLPAEHGESLWIEYGDGPSVHRWLIDCGTEHTATELLRRVEAVPKGERLLELFVMSHIDSDHIGGALPFFKAIQGGLQICDVWFNGWRQLSGKLGARQGEMFSTAIQDFKLPWNVFRKGGPIVVAGGTLPEHQLPGGMKLTLLSPGQAELRKLAPVWTREMKRYGLEPGSRVDYSKFLRGTPSTSTDVRKLADSRFAGDDGAPNGTSIAVLAEFAGARALFTADAHAPVLVASIRALLKERGEEKLKLDAFKVSHHASQNNVSTELISLLDCPRYLVSTNGNHFCHPDREAIARVINYGGKHPEIYFNYETRYNKVWLRKDLQEKYGYAAHYPEAGKEGLKVSLLPGA